MYHSYIYICIYIYIFIDLLPEIFCQKFSLIRIREPFDMPKVPQHASVQLHQICFAEIISFILFELMHAT